MDITRITGSWDKFSTSLKKEIEKFHEKKVKLVKEIALYGLSGIQIGSPVDTGRFRSGHDLTINDPSIYNPEKGYANEVYTQIAKEALRAAGHKLSQLPRGFLEKIVIFITNNVEYGVYIENGSYSNDPNAPQKIYDRMADMLRTKIDEEIAKFKI